jgi:hypothetical protein
VKLMQLKALVQVVFSVLPGMGANAADKSEEVLWLQTYDAREKYFESVVGPLPADIFKMTDVGNIWPAGGLHAIPAPKLGKGLDVYTTFGLTNADMPATTRLVDLKPKGKENPQALKRLERKEPAPKRPGAAGYGYELIVVAQRGLDWPLSLLQWVVHAELLSDIGLLNDVEKYGGITVEEIDVGEPEPVNILISKALPPLPTGTQLPAGKMEILVATVITAEEMRWSMGYRRDALLQRLKDAGVGQISKLKRESVVR